MATVTVVYFKNGWLKQVKGQEYIDDDWTERVRVDYTYNELGRRTARNNNNSDDILTDYAYNDRGELMRIDHDGLYEMGYTHDGAGNPMAIAYSGTNCPAVLDDKTVTYTYNDTWTYNFGR